MRVWKKLQHWWSGSEWVNLVQSCCCCWEWNSSQWLNVGLFFININIYVAVCFTIPKTWNHLRLSQSSKRESAIASEWEEAGKICQKRETSEWQHNGSSSRTLASERSHRQVPSSLWLPVAPLTFNFSDLKDFEKPHTHTWAIAQIILLINLLLLKGWLSECLMSL